VRFSSSRRLVFLLLLPTNSPIHNQFNPRMTSRRMAYGIFMALTTELASVARAFPIVARRSSFPFPPSATTGRSVRSALYSTTTDSGAASPESPEAPQPDPVAQPAVVPIYLAQGLFAVDKPLDWTSSNVVSYIRRMLERDARERGAKPGKVGRSKRSVKVGHGGTLDPLATGVLVIGTCTSWRAVVLYAARVRQAFVHHLTTTFLSHQASDRGPKNCSTISVVPSATRPVSPLATRPTHWTRRAT
jgi:hypothetical protein